MIRTESCWLISDLRIDETGIWALMVLPERIVKLEGRNVTTWFAPGYTMRELEEIAHACWRLPPGPPEEEVLSEQHLEPLLSHQYLNAIEVLRILAVG
ncbi:MAG: hypothetical protein KGJ57_22855 [Sphingomonadales bacterium]|nr:hypothetical protein [Sphingomonadales bacterium]MDE2172226.1 hypothetical protein [Sphingomonadales bacterium]